MGEKRDAPIHLHMGKKDPLLSVIEVDCTDTSWVMYFWLTEDLRRNVGEFAERPLHLSEHLLTFSKLERTMRIFTRITRRVYTQIVPDQALVVIETTVRFDFGVLILQHRLNISQ